MKKALFRLGLIRSLLAIVVVAAVVGVIGARLAEGEPPPPRTPTLSTPPVPTEPSIIPAHVVRWGNVTLTLPADSGLTAVRSFWGPDSDPPAIFLRSRGNGGSSLAIDAETGEVLSDRVEPEDRAAVNQVLQTLTVSPLDRDTAPWPYSGEPPNVPRESWGKITFIPPDPASGISIRFGHADGLGSSSLYLKVTNGQSVFLISADTGDVYPDTVVIAPEDRDAFDRFLSSIQYVGS